MACLVQYLSRCHDAEAPGVATGGRDAAVRRRARRPGHDGRMASRSRPALPHVSRLWGANWQIWHESPLWCSLVQIGRQDSFKLMRDLLLLAIHLRLAIFITVCSRGLGGQSVVDRA